MASEQRDRHSTRHAGMRWPGGRAGIERDHIERNIQQLDAMVTDDDLAQALDEERTRGIDRGAAIALALLSVVLIAILSSLAWYPRIALQLHLQPHPSMWAYAVAIAAFLPLAVRRDHPIAALVLSSAFAALYLAMPWPPAIVILAPMTALFTVSERYGQRAAVPVGIVLGAIVLGVSAMTVSVSYTVAQVVAILALLGLSAALGHGAQTRRELFEEVREKRRETELRREEESLRRVEEERLRIARDVHDIMAHSLTLMTLQADAGLAIPDDAEKSRAAFTVIGDTGRATLRDLRSMLSVLAGDAGDESPREPVADLGQLDALVRSVRETGLDVELVTTGDVESVPSAVAVSAYRIVQESLTNIVRHAHAKHATARVDIKDDKLALLVIDDGIGDAGANASASGHEGRGLAGMRERVDVLGGTITAEPGRGGGFEVRAVIPLTRSQK